MRHGLPCRSNAYPSGGTGWKADNNEHGENAQRDLECLDSQGSIGCACLWGFIEGALKNQELLGWALLPLALLAFGRAAWRLRQLHSATRSGDDRPAP